jgi:hypothetical protein
LQQIEQLLALLKITQNIAFVQFCLHKLPTARRSPHAFKNWILYGQSSNQLDAPCLVSGELLTVAGYSQMGCWRSAIAAHEQVLPTHTSHRYTVEAAAESQVEPRRRGVGSIICQVRLASLYFLQA